MNQTETTPSPLTGFVNWKKVKAILGSIFSGLLILCFLFIEMRGQPVSAWAAADAVPEKVAPDSSGKANTDSGGPKSNPTGSVAGSPQSLEGSTKAQQSGDGDLTVSGVFYADQVRYPVAAVLSAGSSTVPVTTTGFTAGDEVLIINIQGDDSGRHETAFVSAVNAASLTLASPLQHSYDGSNDSIMVQRIPHYGQVTVELGGELTAHAWDGQTGGVLFLRAANVTVQAGGTIAVNEKGYAADSGPGDPIGDTGEGRHGGHTESSGELSPYGNPLQPVNLGSGGRTAGSGAGGSGGGAIHVVVSNTLTLSGSISANGASGVGGAFSTSSGGGAGGSIWLETTIIVGNGVIEANGNDGGVWEDVGPGGAGGRIALYATTNDFSSSGSLQAYGGDNSGDHVGGAGTVYLNDGNGTLLVDNGGYDGPQAGLPANTYSFDTMQLSGGGHLEVKGPLSLTGQLLGDGTSSLTGSDSMTMTAVSQFQDVAVTALSDLAVADSLSVHTAVDVQGTLKGASNVTLDQGGNLKLYAATYPSGALELDQLQITDGVLDLISYDDGDTDYSDDYGFTLTANNITVSDQGTISADGTGYGPDRGPGTPGTDPDAGVYQSGAGHGGQGGQGEGSDYSGGPTYGNPEAPVTLGSGGGGTTGSIAGGAVHLVVDDSLWLDGVVTADAVPIFAPNDPFGGSSGGSIWIETAVISGSGIIRANGIAGSFFDGNGGGGGGGGYIALYMVQDDFTTAGSLEVDGGAIQFASQYDGLPGQIYISNLVPVAGLSAGNDSPSTLGQATAFTATVTAGDNVSYTWAFGDGEFGNGSVVSYTYGSVGTYTAVVTASNPYGAVTTTTPVTITDAPITGLTAANDSPNVVGEATTLSASIISGTNASYTWNFGDPSDATPGSGPVVTHTYGTPGNYTAVVTASNSVNSLTTTTDVTVTNVPITDLAASNDSPTIAGETTTLSASITSGTNVGYVWDFDDPNDGTPGFGALITHTYTTPGNYTAVVTASNSANTLTSTTPVTITDIPITGLAAANDSPTTVDTPTVFTATITAGGNVSYRWDFGDGNTAAGAVVSHTYTTAGNYTAVVTASNSANSLTSTTPVTITDIPITGLAAANDSPTALNSPTAFTATVATGSDVFYDWYFGDGGVANGATVTHTYTAAGNYTAIVTASNSANSITTTTDVTVYSDLVDPSTSHITVTGKQTAAADGQDAVQIEVTARTESGDPIPEASVILTSTDPVVFTQPTQATDLNGRTTGAVASQQVGPATIGAVINGVHISPTVTITFAGADLDVTKAGPGEAVAGFPISYSISVANQGLLTATNVVVTDTLPATVTFASSTYTATTAGNDVVWQLGDLAPEAAVDIVLEGTVDAGAANTTIQNDVTAVQSGAELDLANNDDSADTDVVVPSPVLFVPQSYPNLVVPQGATNTLTLAVRNTGTDLLANAVVSPAATLPNWISVSPTNLGDIPYQSGSNTISFTVTADAGSVYSLTAGYYRDILTVQTDNAGSRPIYLTVRVQNPARDVGLNISNNAGQPVPEAKVTLEEPIYLVTQGQVSSDSYYWQGTTDANGRLDFPGLESGKSYTFTITAPNHQSLSGALPVNEGSGTQEENIELVGLPSLVTQPEQMIFPATRGRATQHQLVLYNQGAAPVTNVAVQAPADLPWVYLGQPPSGGTIPAGGQMTVLVNAAPTLSQTADIYQSAITVTADDGVSVSTPLEIRLNDGVTRTLEIQVLTEGDSQPLPNATVVLANQTGMVVANGTVTETLDQVLVEQTDANGYVTFPNLIPGPYRATVGVGDEKLGEKEIEVVPDSGSQQVQQEVILVEEGGLVTTFSVIPGTITDTYTTVMTMTFIPHATPRVTLYPRQVNLCDAPSEGITETITIHNFYNVAFNNVEVKMAAYGNVVARLTTLDGSQSVEYDPSLGDSLPLPIQIGTIPPLTDSVKLQLNARLLNGTCSQNQGGVYLHATGDWVHGPPRSWYSFVPYQTPYSIQPDGQPHDIPLVLSNAGYPAESNLNGEPPDLQNITLTPPQNLDWMGLDTTQVVSLPVDSEFTFNLVVTPTQWLAPGTYYDHILIQASNGITALIGIEADMSADGLRVETELITPLYASAGSGSAAASRPVVTGRAAGLAAMIDYLPPEQATGGDLLDLVWASLADLYNESPTVTLLDESWELNVGCDCNNPEPITWTPVGNKLIVTGGSGGNWAPVTRAPDFKDNVVVLRLEQRFSFEREAFFAQLELDNGSLFNDLTDFSVDLIITTVDGDQVIQRLPGQVLSPTTSLAPVLPPTSTLISTQTLASEIPGYWVEIPPVNFVVIPEEAEVPDLGTRGTTTASHAVNWTIVPDAFGLTEPIGEQFFVSAVINYSKGGVPQDPVVTTQEPIWVHPQPRLMLDYFVPDYVLGGQTFDWVVVVTNIGYGTARNFRIETPQPQIVKQSDKYPTDFTLIGESVIEFGDLGPGDQFVDAWQIVPSNPGTFVDWEATCVHENYMGVELPPLMSCVPNIHVISVNPPVAESQQWGKENSCLVGSYQGFDSDPVNTFSGNFTHNEMDVSIPAWGPPLEFERSYNSRDAADGPLGPGWTHNYNMALIRESFVPVGGGQVQDYMTVRLPRGSRAYFEIEADGVTFTPLPGVRAALEWDGSAQEYRLTRPNDQTLYTFNYTQTLKSIEDSNGNRLTFSYYADEVSAGVFDYYLKDVTGPAGRQLTFTYNADWHMTSMTDPLGRTAVYGYSDGMLTSATDFRSQTTQYTYTAPGTELPGQLETIVDANGHTAVTNHYNSQRRVDWQEDALGNRTTFSYLVDPFADTRTTVVSDARGHETTDIYDGNGRLVERRDAHGFFETYEYNEDNNLTRLVDKNGHDTTYQWNDCGCDVTQVTDPLGNTTVMAYDGNNQVTSIQDERNDVTTIAYDGRNNPITTTNPAGDSVIRDYGARGQLLWERDENDHTTFYGYDTYGNTSVITDALGHVVHMNYDLAGRLLDSSNALSRTTSYDYDGEDNLVQVTAPLSTTTSYDYDPVGNLVQTTDALGRITAYAYNARNEQTVITNTLNDTQTFAYDEVGNRVSASDENGNTTTYQYDGLNRLVTVTNPLSGTLAYTYDPVGNRLREEDANGNVTQYIYDDNDRRVDTVFPDGSVMHATYDEADNLLTLTDAEGRTVVYTYDALGRTLTKTDPVTGTNGGTTTYVYDGVGNQTGLTDTEGRTTIYRYDDVDRLVRVTDPLSGTTEIGYDAVGNRVSLTDANGRTATFDYDDLDRMVSTTDPLSGTTSFAYDAVGNQIQVTDPLGRVTTTDYDALNRPLTVTNALGNFVSFTYDGVGNLLTETDEEGRTTTYQYDALYRTTDVIDPLSGTTRFTYDDNGNLLSQTDAEGRTTTYQYDELDQLFRMTDPITGTTTYDYDNVGNLVSVTDANGHTMTYRYDGLDRMIEARDALSNTTGHDYDKVGNLVTLTDAENNSTSYEYDELDRLVQTTDALNHTTAFAYDAVGNQTVITDAKGRITTFVYDELDRPLQTTDALSQTTTFAYDAVGNQTVITDAKGRITTFTYDDLNRLTQVTDPNENTTIYTYSAAGNLLSEQNPLSQITTYDYDALNRLTHVTDPLGQVMTTTYDAVGNPLSIIDVGGRSTQFAYDGLDRLRQVTDPLGGQTTYAYDGVGNQTAVTNAENQTIQYVYDDADRLVTVIDPLAQQTRFAYDKVGNQVNLTDPLSRTVTYTYDSLYRLTAVIDAAGNPSQYGYDEVGNQTAITDSEGRTTTFQYDALNRPITVTDPLSGTASFVYDEVGNQIHETDAEGRVVTYTYDALNRLQQVIDPLGNSTTNAYDALGNLTSLTDALNRTTSYRYDALNRLVEVTNPLSGTTQFAYDPVGNLVQQVDPLDNSTGYVYDALDRVITETDALSGTTGYAYDAIGNLLQVTDANGHTAQMSYDDLNRLETVTDPLGEVTTYVYDAVGNNTAVVDPLGRTTQFDYDVLDRLLAVTDPLSRTTSYAYDRVGNHVGLTDAEGVTTRYDYDALNRLSQVTENHVPGGPANADTNVTTQFGYDAVGNLTEITNPLDNSSTFTYDPLNRVDSSQDPLGNESSYDYDAVGNLVQLVDANGNSHSYGYDALNRLQTLTRPDEAVSFSYDAAGNRLSMSDATGVTSYGYDDLYRLTRMTDPFSQTVQYGYDAVGNRTSLVYPGGYTAVYGYDAANRLRTVLDWDGGLTQYDYDQIGRLAQMVLPNGITSTYQYDDADQLTSLQHAHPVSGSLASYAYSYDQVGNRTQAVETVMLPPDLNVPTAVFTATPRSGATPLAVTFFNRSTDADTFTWEFGDGISLTTGSLAPISHTYTTAGVYTVSLTAANAQYSHVLTRSGYISVIPGDAFQEVDGLVTLEAENAHASLAGNGSGWLTRTAFSGYTGTAYLQPLPDVDNLYAGTAVTTSPELRFQVSFATAGSYVVWARGAAANAAGDSLHVGLDGATTAGSDKITGFRFNQWRWSAQTMDGLTATLTIPEPGLYTITVWAREDGLRLDRLLLTTDTAYVPGGQGPAESPRAGEVQASLLPQPRSTVATSLAVNDAFLLAQERQRRLAQAWAMVLANSGGLLLAPLLLTAPFAYRRKRRRHIRIVTAVLLALVIVGLGVALVSAGGPSATDSVQWPVNSEQWSVVGDPLAADGQSNAPRSTLHAPHSTLSALQSGTTTIDYGYDPLYRLTDAVYSSGASFGYGYDAAGNRLSYSVDGSPVMTYTYDAANRLTAVHDLVAAQVIPHSYDNNGNLLNDGQYSYSYDTANRLTGLDDGVSTVSYTYNGDGVRVAQIVDGLRTDYVQDVATPLPQVLTARQGGTVSSYLRGLGLIGEQQGSSPGAWQYHLPDGLGSVRQVVDAQAAVTLGREYDPFGGLITDVGSATSAYGFAGEEQDPDTEQVYLRARTYNPESGRFLQQDDVLGSPNQPRTLHRYTYAFNNPINYTDPSGHMPPGAGNGSASNNGGGNGPQFVGGTPGFFPTSSPGRSANNVNWPTFSNPLARLQSQGHRSLLCGAIGAVNSLMAWGHQLSAKEVQTLIGASIIVGSLVVTGGASLPYIFLGGALGAGIGYGAQAWQNVWQKGMTLAQALNPQNIDRKVVVEAAFQGAVSGAVAGVVDSIFPVGGSGLGKVLMTAAVEAVSGRAERIAVNLSTGRPWDENLWNPRSGAWWKEVALDILPGVGATVLKPAFKGLKRGIAGAVGGAASSGKRLFNAATDRLTARWRLTQRLDDFVTRGTPINPWNRLKATIEPYKALAAQVARGAPGAPGRLLSVIRGADRAGWKAFWKAGLQPDYVTRLNRFAQANDLEIGFRTSKRMSLLWRLFDLPAKPLTVKTKTRFGIVRGMEDGIWYRSDMDLAYIRSPETGELLSDLKVQGLLGKLNEVATGKSPVNRPEFMHPTHWTYHTPGKIGHPESLFVLNAGADSGLVPKHQVRAFAENRGLQWYWDPPRKTLDAQGRLTTGKYTVSGEKMAPHLTGSTTSGKSQFLFRVDAHAAVLDAAHHADAYNLWKDNKAKVFVRQNGPVGVLGRSGELTYWINVYRTNKGIVHGSPGSPP